MIEIFQLPKG